MWTGRIGCNSAHPPTEYRSALPRVITRASQPSSDSPPRSPHPLRVTASHRAIGFEEISAQRSTRPVPRGTAVPGKGLLIVRQRSLIAITAALAAGALTLTACGSRDDDGGSDSGSDGTTVVIGVDAPLTGDLSALGLGIKNSVDLAAKTANKEKTVEGITFKVEALDDQAQPSAGQQNATKFVADKDVLGVVGPLNSSVAESMQKVFDDAKLVEISPPTRARPSPRARTGRPRRSARTSRTSAPRPRTPSRARSPRSTSTTTRRRRRSSSSTTRRPTAPVWPPPSPTSSRRSAARSSGPSTSTPTPRTSPPSSPR